MRLSVIGTNLCKRRTAVQSKETLRGRSLEYRSGTMKHHTGNAAEQLQILPVEMEIRRVGTLR
jgi:hypothetical protein